MRLPLLRNISVFRRLTLSLTAGILAAVILVSIPLFQIFTYQHNRLVADMNRHLLDQYTNVIDEAFIGMVQKVYLDLCLNLSSKTDINTLFAPVYNAGKVQTLFAALPDVRAASSIIEGIHIYSGVHELIVSTSLGVKQNDSKSQEIWPEISLLSDGARLVDGNSYWTDARTTSGGLRVVTFVGSYPAGRSLRIADGSVSIDIKADTIRETLKKINTAPGELILFDKSGVLLAYTGDDALPVATDGEGNALKDLLMMASGTAKAVSIGARSALVSYRVLDNGWAIAGVVPVDTVNSAMRVLAVWIYGITAVVAVICVIIARRSIHKVLKPLNAIIADIGHMEPQAGGGSTGGNELTLIGTALTELTRRVDDLNKTWEFNLPAIKQNLLMSLINRTLHSPVAFNRQMNHFGRRPAGGRCCFILANLLEDEDSVSDPSMVGPDIVKCLEALNSPNRFVVAGELAARQVGALVIDRGRLPESALVAAVSSARELYGAAITISVGSRREDPLDSYLSYQEALEAGRHYFFSPWQSVFYYDLPGSVAEGREDAAYDLSHYVSKFRNDLLRGKHDGIPEIIQAFVRAARSAPLRFEDKRAWLEKMVAVLQEYASGRFPGRDMFVVRYPEESVTDVHEYEEWLGKTVDMVCGWKSDDIETQSRSTIAIIQRYIANNLDKELSLTSLSGYTALSNSYISHIFKEKTGMGLVDYITQTRMDRARELLTGTDKTIEVIARQLGYHTPHYFAKRFRQFFGVPPNEYRAT